MNEESYALGRLVGSTTTGLINIDSNKDGNIQSLEVLHFVSAFAGGVLANYSTFGKAWEQIKEKGSPARQAFTDGFDQGFDLVNDEKELLIEESLDLIIQMIDMGGRWGNSGKNNQVA